MEEIKQLVYNYAHAIHSQNEEDLKHYGLQKKIS